MEMSIFFTYLCNVKPKAAHTMTHFTSKEVNRNFKIKVSGTINGEKINTLVGVSGFLAFVGDEPLAERLLERAFNCPEDRCICKLRRGLKISFYVA